MNRVSREEAQVTHIRGPGMPLLRATMLASLPEERLARLRQGLSPEGLAFITAPVPEMTWVPLPVVLEVEAAFLAQSEVDPFHSHGILMAQRMLDGRFEGLFLSWMGPRAFLRILPVVWSRFNRGGLLQLDQLGECEAALTLWADYPTPIFVAKVVPAFAGEALRRLGAEGATVTYEAPGAGDPSWMHRYRVAWQA